MKRLIQLTVLGCLIFVLGANSSYASSFEFSDAIGYGQASHGTGEWQWLGDTWTAENAPLANDSSDDGVWWSTDGGTNWGHGDIFAGQEVTFRFDMHRAAYGRHEYDQLKAWIDWDGDKAWDNVNEEIIATQWFKNTIEDGNTKFADNVWRDSLAANNGDNVLNPTAVLFKQFYATLVVPEDAYIGETWLRARVSCTHTSFNNTNPYGRLWQGEVEDWALNVRPVPEPGTLFLIGTGILGIVSLSRKRMKK
ncbi:MAG: PEP-CTERM sorting domain-containing protein [Proteobacteria bacterium]|nr:PEP-CTERM sorting domain-containing protein [Pseudomonadota bacterium]